MISPGWWRISNLVPSSLLTSHLCPILLIHDILLNVLTTKFSVTGMALKLPDSYLRPRHCKVAVNGHLSSNKELVFSVPQGSCAGWVLYTPYSSTMFEVVLKQILIHGYADHGLKKSFRPIQHEEEETIKQLQICVAEMKEWINTNRLHMNSKKTEHIWIIQAVDEKQCKE